MNAPAEIHRFSCDACGADMRFDPATGGLVCDHCGHTVAVAEAANADSLRELKYEDGPDQSVDEAETVEVRLTTCQNCGARIEFDQASHAEECPFCATPIVTDTGAERQIKPRGLLPFALTEDDARTAMTGWLSSLWFAPGGLKQYARKGRRMTGIYVPYWTFDADTESTYQGERGTVYYETRTVMRDGKRIQRRVQKVRWRPKSGRVARWFDDVLVLASGSLPKRFTDALPPWDLASLEPYRPEFLAGFSAEGYTVAIDEGYRQARVEMDRVIRRDVRFDIGGDRQRIHSVNTRVSNVTYKHILLPIWLAAYKYHGKTYRFVVNGRTGRVQGERPWSWPKIILTAIVVIAIAAAAGYALAVRQGTV